MDISKLPKLSQTPADGAPEAPPAAEDAAAPQVQAPRVSRAVADADDRRNADADFSVGEIWFNLIIGLIFLFLGQRFGGYLFAKLTHQTYHTGWFWPPGAAKAGQEVVYPELDGNGCRRSFVRFVLGRCWQCHCRSANHAGGQKRPSAERNLIRDLERFVHGLHPQCSG